MPPDTHEIELRVNGTSYQRSVEARMLLSDFLRHELRLAGTHVGCELSTVEGLATASGDLSPLQRAMHEHHGLQCGYCTPGILMTMTAFLKDNPAPSEDEVREALSGNLCRCTGYQNIVDAVLKAAETLQASVP